LANFVSPNYFDLLGVSMTLGQPFTEGVRQGHWAPEAVLSYNFWKRRFGADPAVVGRTIRLNTYPFTIVGVSQPGFTGLERGADYELRIPMMPDGDEFRQIDAISTAGDRNLRFIARLKPGVSPAQTEASADVQFQEFLRTTSNRGFRDRQPQHFRLIPLV